MTLYEKQDVDLLKDIVPVASIDNDAFAVVVVAGELFRMISGIQVTHVPYRGAPAANTSVMTGETHLLFNALPPKTALHAAARLRHPPLVAPNFQSSDTLAAAPFCSKTGSYRLASNSPALLYPTENPKPTTMEKKRCLSTEA